MNSSNLLLGFMGDVMIGRGVDTIIEDKGNKYVWGDLLPLLKTTDLNVANLETTLTSSDRKVDKAFNFRAAPGRVNCLNEANIRVVNVANNHILDFSDEGLLETLRVLKEAGIKYTGAGHNIEEASAAISITAKNISIAILGYTDNEAQWKADANKCGTNYIDISNKKERRHVLQQVERLKAQHDVVIISIHWGPNMVVAPSKIFVDFAHEMIDNGATIIHGHSAHNFQGIEVYKHKLIIYDTGDFVDDYMVHEGFRNDHSFLFLVQLNHTGIISLELIPVLISDYRVNRARGEDAMWSLERMQRLSERFGTVIVGGHIKFNA